MLHEPLVSAAGDLVSQQNTSKCIFLFLCTGYLFLSLLVLQCFCVQYALYNVI